MEQSNKENRYLLYPNPAVLGEFVTLQTDSAEPHVIEIQVVNNMGAVLYQKTFSIVSGKDEVYLDTNSLNTGINFLKIIDESNTITFFKIFMK